VKPEISPLTRTASNLAASASLTALHKAPTVQTFEFMHRLSQNHGPLKRLFAHQLKPKSSTSSEDPCARRKRASTARLFVQVFDLNGFFADDFFDFLNKHRIHAVCGRITQTYPHLYPPFL
jgi:hypothetical protein